MAMRFSGSGLPVDIFSEFLRHSSDVGIFLFAQLFFSYVDYRPNQTYTDDVGVACRCIILNKDLDHFDSIILIMAKGSNVVFSLFVYMIIFCVFYWNKKKTSKNANFLRFYTNQFFTNF